MDFRVQSVQEPNEEFNRKKETIIEKWEYPFLMLKKEIFLLTNMGRKLSKITQEIKEEKLSKNNTEDPRGIRR